MATKLKLAYTEGGLNFKAQTVTREIDGLLVTLSNEGLFLREKGRKLTVGPFDFKHLYQDGVQRQAGNAPLKPRTPRKGSKQVKRGLLATGDGK
jgi:hypothetical protein